MAVGLTLVRLFLLSVDDYKTTIESKIFELTEIPLGIGTLQANMRGFNPGIILKDIRVFPTGSHEQQSIKLEEIRFSINLLELIWTQQLLPSSWLTLVGAEITVIRQEDGSLLIKGLNSTDSKQPFWLLSGGRYEVLKSDITWIDKQRHAKPLKFKNIDLLLKNDVSSENHEIHLLSKLPKSMGESLRISMSIQGNVFKKDNINGVIYIKGTQVQLAEIFTGEKPAGVKIAAGKGDFELWSQWEKSKNVAITGNVQATNIRLKKPNQTYNVDRLETSFNGLNNESGWQFGVTDFKAKEGDKIWPTANFIFSGNKQLTKIAASIGQLDLQQFSNLMQFFSPLDKEKQDLLTKLALKGQLKDFSAYINTEQKTFAVNGRVKNIHSHSFANTPQIRNLSASVYGTEKKGVLGFDTQNASLFFPDIFRSSISINKLSGLVVWQQKENNWIFNSKQLVLNVKDAQTKSAFKLTLPKNNVGSATMDLQSYFANLNDVSTIPNYYPTGIMDKDTLTWLDNAFISGNIKQGGLLFSGKFNQYPFSQDEGVFEVLLDARDVELQFSPDWPHLKHINAEIAFQQQGLTVISGHAEVNNMHISSVLVEIPDLEKSKNVVVKGYATGKITNGLEFMQQTPLKNIADNFLDVISPTGNITVSLDSKIPLVETLQAQVEGMIGLNKVGLHIKPIDLNVTNLKGDLKFTEKGVFGSDIKASALGSLIAINIDTQNANTTVTSSGKTSIKQLQQQFSFLSAALLAKNKVQGKFDYQLKLQLPAAERLDAKLNIKSNLVGVTMNLPGLLKKQAHEKKQLTLNFSLNNKPLLPLKINFNNAVKAAIYIDKNQKKIHSANIAYGEGLAAMPKEQAVKVNVSQARFDLTEWLAFMGSYNSNVKTPPLVNKLSFKTSHLLWNNQDYGNFELAMTHNKTHWLGHLLCSSAEGDFIIPFKQNNHNKIKLDMNYIKLSELVSLKPGKESSEIIDLPLIDIYSKQLLWNSTDLGTLEIGMERISEGFRFNPVSVISEDLEIKMSADWVKQGKGSVSYFYGELNAADIGKVMSKIGLGDDIKETEAKIDYSGQWPGAPYQFSLAEMEADVILQFKGGRISSIEPGFGRVLGFLAMEQWVKRLTLDFGDLYKKGLSFNKITGLFTLSKGIAKTKRLFVDAIPAQISLSGDTNLISKTLDYSVDVIPKSSGALPIAGTIIGSIAGTITQAVTSDYKKGYFFGSKYHLSGKWGDLKLKALQDEGGLFNKTWAGFIDLFRDTPVIE